MSEYSLQKEWISCMPCNVHFYCVCVCVSVCLWSLIFGQIGHWNAWVSRIYFIFQGPWFCRLFISYPSIHLDSTCGSRRIWYCTCPFTIIDIGIWGQWGHWHFHQYFYFCLKWELNTTFGKSAKSHCFWNVKGHFNSSIASEGVICFNYWGYKSIRDHNSKIMTHLYPLTGWIIIKEVYMYYLNITPLVDEYVSVWILKSMTYFKYKFATKVQSLDRTMMTSCQ